ncbi:nucleoside-diphosphate kinase [Nonomuraea sp. NPDC049750]|uniref:nucleoside-diphosphate kinase n=1 Tax=Nonomuraea sp. NPDC049750 TaxID=3154738 RepID=UPI0033F606F9
MITRRANGTNLRPPGGWDYWTVVMCKPDATERRLVRPILEWIAGTVTIVQIREVVVTAQQILAHYADMLELQHRFPFDVRADLIDHYVGSTVTVALARGYTNDTAQRVRDLLGHYDPSRAPSITIRGYYGDDSAEKAAAEGRFIRNLVHTSDNPTDAAAEFRIWFGEPHRHILDQEAHTR